MTKTAGSKRRYRRDGKRKIRVRGSGKQFLMHIIKELSTKKIPKKGLGLATDKIRAGLLLHASTSEDTCRAVRQLSWIRSPSKGKILVQGLGLADKQILVLDFLEEMLCMPEVKELMRAKFNLDEIEFDACYIALWSLVSAAQMYEELLLVELPEDEFDANYWLRCMKKKFCYFFPEGMKVAESEDGVKD